MNGFRHVALGAALAVLALAGAGLEARAQEAPAGSRFMVEQRTIIISIRPPALEELPPPPAGQPELRPGRPAGACVRADRIEGGRMISARLMELRLATGRILRLHLAEDCPSVGYYGGFYVVGESGRLCAGRDYLVSRAGQRCAIGALERRRPRSPVETADSR